jgi:hypothetical protein
MPAPQRMLVTFFVALSLANISSKKTGLLCMTILSAEVATIQLGFIEFDGLMDKDGNYYVAIPQIASVFQFLTKNASRDINSLLGNDFQFPKFKTSLHPKAVNAIPVVLMESLILELAIRGNEQAILMSRALIGLSLQQLFSDAFDIKFDKQQRQEYLKLRLSSKQTRRALTDAIKDWYARNPNGTTRPQHAMYSATTNLIYQALWGLDAKGIENLIGCDRHRMRNSLDDGSLKLLDYAEHNVIDYIDGDNIKPVDAVALANIRKAKQQPTLGLV